ncbi:MAG TPA: DUF1990 domain-containing protein [Myxococcota bacterium]|nr:DUF1990 domain-containing protein [Myxococcota bacterium]
MFTYPEVGLSRELDSAAARERLARRYDVDRREFALGKGRDVFERARSALLSWRHFEVPWLTFHRSGPVAQGQGVATVLSIAGIWFVNPCRVVYTELDRPDRVAFGYGTLRGHAESGEEQFRVSFDPVTDQVSYSLSAFSRPALLATRVAYPLARRVQARFAADSARALAQASA